MIIKSFEINKIKLKNNKLFLIYGSNEGHKKQVIKDIFEKSFTGKILRYEEDEVLINYEEFILDLTNESLFEDQKLVIISRVTEKILDLVDEVIERKIEKLIIIFNSNILEKKSKLRILFEKENDLICIPFYEDNDKNLSFLAQNFCISKI